MRTCIRSTAPIKETQLAIQWQPSSLSLARWIGILDMASSFGQRFDPLRSVVALLIYSIPFLLLVHGSQILVLCERTENQVGIAGVLSEYGRCLRYYRK